MHVTCDRVRVIVPRLLCDVEYFRDHRSGPTGQLAETQRAEMRQTGACGAVETILSIQEVATFYSGTGSPGDGQ